MRIEKLIWENYRRLPDAVIDVRDHLVLVGPNDSGKSSVLRAVQICLGMPGPQLGTALELRDFTDPSKPLKLGVRLTDLDQNERAAFPDEVVPGPPPLLRVVVDAEIDPDDGETVTLRRGFPDSGHSRPPSRAQLAEFRWAYIPATRSLFRELGTTSGSVVQTLLAGLDLSADEAALNAAIVAMTNALDASGALGEFRQEISEVLSDALPNEVTVEDVGLKSAAEMQKDPLTGVTVTVRDGDHMAPLAEQSDGIRALTALALLTMSKKTAQIVGIDEPETHLHPSAQRSVAATLRSAQGQRLIATHSPAIVSQMHPSEIVAFGADRRPRQLRADAPIGQAERATRHWSNRLIEPLTARHLLLVEGPSDRILVASVASMLDIDLDRRGVAIFELDSCDFFSTAYELFGPEGFDLPLSGLVDEDACEAWAEILGCDESELEGRSMFVCRADLEDEYVRALGREITVAALLASPQISEAALLQGCGVTSLGDITEEMLATYCRHKRRKVRAALAITTALTPDLGALISPVAALIQSADAT